MTVRIRPWAAGDAPALVEAARESWETVEPWLPWCRRDYALADAQAWVGSMAPDRHEFAVTDEAGRLLGGVGLNAIRGGVANLGYWVRASARGRGVASAAVEALVDWALANTSLRRIEALVPVDNAASLRVAEACGAAREGIAPGRLRLRGRPVDAVVFAFGFARPGSPPI